MLWERLNALRSLIQQAEDISKNKKGWSHLDGSVLLLQLQEA